MKSPVAKATVPKTIVTEAISAEAISAEGTLTERRSSIEAACPETRAGVHAAESMAATNVTTAKPASTRESGLTAAVSADSASPAAAHLRQGRHRRSEQEDCRHKDRRRVKKALHN